MEGIIDKLVVLGRLLYHAKSTYKYTKELIALFNITLEVIPDLDPEL